MRTRARNETVTIDGGTNIWYWDDPEYSDYGDSAGGTSTSGKTFDALSEQIEDQVLKWDDYGTCLHSKAKLTIFPSGGTRRRTTPNGQFHQKNVRTAWFIPAYFHQWIDTIPPVSFGTLDWDLYSSQALESVLPTFSEDGESLINAILELKDLKRLFHLWKNKHSKLKKAASIHLGVSFGWLPFIGDCQRLYSSLENFRTKVRQLQQRSGKVRVGRYRRYVDLAKLPSNGSNLQTDDYSFRRIQFVWEQYPVYHATVKYCYVLPDMSLLLNQVGGFLDSLGVQLNAAVVWNAIPFSFVVDWFFSVGDFLNHFRVENRSIPVTILGFCHSVKWNYSAKYYLREKYENYSGGALTPSGPDLHIASREFRSYIRRKDIPSLGLLDTTVKTPNWKQALLGASLTVTRF